MFIAIEWADFYVGIKKKQTCKHTIILIMPIFLCLVILDTEQEQPAARWKIQLLLNTSSADQCLHYNLLPHSAWQIWLSAQFLPFTMQDLQQQQQQQLRHTPTPHSATPSPATAPYGHRSNNMINWTHLNWKYSQRGAGFLFSSSLISSQSLGFSHWGHYLNFSWGDVELDDKARIRV